MVEKVLDGRKSFWRLLAASTLPDGPRQLFGPKYFGRPLLTPSRPDSQVFSPIHETKSLLLPLSIPNPAAKSRAYQTHPLPINLKFGEPLQNSHKISGKKSQSEKSVLEAPRPLGS